MSTIPQPAGFTLLRLVDQPLPLHRLARQSCLDTIREFYGFDDRPDWHVDLGSLLVEAAANHWHGAENRPSQLELGVIASL